MKAGNEMVHRVSGAGAAELERPSWSGRAGAAELERLFCYV